MIGILASYYNNQLKKRKNSQPISQRVHQLRFNNLCSHIILRKSYVSNRFIDNLQIRRSLSNINSYTSTICIIRNTKLYIGFPRHILSFLFRDRYIQRRS